MDEQSTHEENPENIGNAFTGFANTDVWLKRFERCSHAVCRIEIPGGTAQGTGFLIQPGMIITNYHVMQPVIDDPSLHERVVIRFGFQTILGDRGLSAGTECELATDANWIAASSPTQELDFALVRIRATSTNTVNMASMAKIALYRLTPEAYYTFIPAEPLCILQHPLGNAQQITWGSVVRVKGDDTRIYYTTETLEGSSGAPCFNSDMKLVALHQGNQKNTNEKRGIPFPTIMEYLHQHYQDVCSETTAKRDVFATSRLVSVYEYCCHSRSVVQSVYDIFYSEKTISGDKRLLSYERLKNAKESLREAFEQLAQVRISDISIRRAIFREQASFNRYVDRTMLLLHNSRMEATSLRQRSTIKRQLDPVLRSLRAIDALIVLYSQKLM